MEKNIILKKVNNKLAQQCEWIQRQSKWHHCQIRGWGLGNFENESQVLASATSSAREKI